jgi:hypothetical protein
MAGEPVTVYRKRALTVERGPRGKVRYCRPAAEAGSAKVSTADACAAEVRPATTAEMRRAAAHPHPATAEMSAAAHRMGSAATSTAMKSSSATSSGARVSGADESGGESNGGEGLDS